MYLNQFYCMMVYNNSCRPKYVLIVMDLSKINFDCVLRPSGKDEEKRNTVYEICVAISLVETRMSRCQAIWKTQSCRSTATNLSHILSYVLYFCLFSIHTYNILVHMYVWNVWFGQIENARRRMWLWPITLLIKSVEDDRCRMQNKIAVGKV